MSNESNTNRPLSRSSGHNPFGEPARKFTSELPPFTKDIKSVNIGTIFRVLDWVATYYELVPRSNNQNMEPPFKKRKFSDIDSYSSSQSSDDSLQSTVEILDLSHNLEKNVPEMHK